MAATVSCTTAYAERQETESLTVVSRAKKSNGLRARSVTGDGSGVMRVQFHAIPLKGRSREELVTEDAAREQVAVVHSGHDPESR